MYYGLGTDVKRVRRASGQPTNAATLRPKSITTVSRSFTRTARQS